MSNENERHSSSRSGSDTSPQRSPYEFTKAGLIGDQRDTMLQSELQILPELGKSRRRGHRLPPQSFTYGITMPRRDGGVGEALSHGPEKERTTNPDFEFVRDYSALNKAALEAGMTSAKDQSRFRTVHDIKKKVFIRDVSLAKKTHKFPDDMVFGTPNRPSTPIGEVLQNRFLDNWLDTMEKKQAAIKKERTDAANAFKGSYHTKASLLRQAKIPVDPKPLWKMPKFAQGENQVDSFRTEAERRKAFSANTFDSIPRQGTYHSGIYNVPRTTVKT
ncbi:unnamed protein product [Rotaria socialis]|uniref:Cilia- and flagella-associated protein 77 n=1 Tax=Rotaria socialis TaxID=392032 RepID=A0A817L843_9BILA|nr:unnamed protein product [Rotaria socialis]CAF3328567.1 unnamed protein product [Rotaria socialis]CAF3386299.1 unnamed protein product [Rotaria socialis]CAF3503695.1 unnamed protein product [Rotaria socialis]CAF3768887.1 unnamed protein product [Rotaria socialis]